MLSVKKNKGDNYMKDKTDLTYAEMEGTSWLRLLEMNVERRTTTLNNVPLVMQFFRDLKVYGLNETIEFVRGYERDGYFEKGTTEELEKIREQIIAKLKNPMPTKEKYILTDFDMEDIFNRYTRVERQLPVPSYNKEVMVNDTWVRGFAELARIPLEVAYVWTVNEWVPKVITEDVKVKAQELQESGKVTVEI